MNRQVHLMVNGLKYSAWKSVSIEASMEAAARTFNLQITEPIPKKPEAVKVRAGMPCQVLIGKDPVITGYIDDVDSSYNVNSHTVNVTGRCKTADLVDCSPALEINEWKDRTLEQIVKDICTPYGIEVLVEADTGEPFKMFRLEQGERCIEAIERLCRHRGLLRYSNGHGQLVIAKSITGKAQFSLETGKNILSGSAKTSHLERFSKYIVKGQSNGDDNLFGSDASEPASYAEDKSIRHRESVILAEEAGDASVFSKRATWEATVRRARSLEIFYKTHGWENGGKLFLPNTIAAVDDRVLGVFGNYLISTVSFSLDDSGTITNLGLVPLGAFDIQAVPEETEEGFGGLQ